MIGKKLEKGQTIILVVISVFLMIVMAGLVIDGGNTYLNRRKAQTAADAAALAGAHAYCVGHLVPYTPEFDGVVNEYATVQNDADSVTYTFEAANTEYPKGKITVETTINTTTFFAKVLNRPTITVKTDAAAGCFLPAEANNLLPVAWTCTVHTGEVQTCVINQIPVDIFDDIVANQISYDFNFDEDLLDVGDETTSASYMTDKDFIPGTEGKLVYMVMDDADFDENLNCAELNPPGEDLTADPPNPPGVGLITCDFDGDGIVNVQGSERGWLDLGLGGGAVDLWTLMLDGYPGILELPQWFIASDGVKNSVFINAHQIKFRKSLVPVYNAICPIPGSSDTTTSVEELPTDCPDQYQVGDLILDTTANTEFFRVPGVAVFVVTCVSKGNAEYCPGKDLSNVTDNTSTIEGYFLSGYIAGKKIATGGFDLGVYVLSLTE